VMLPLSEKWRPKRVKHLSRLVTSGSRGWADFYADDGPLFLRIGNLTEKGIDLDLAEIQHVKVPAGAEGARTRVQQGDVLVSITALIGAVGFVREHLDEAYVNQHLALVRPSAVVDPRWLAYALRSQLGRDQFMLRMYGGTKVGLGLDDVREVQVPLPGLDLQHALADFLDRKTSAIDDLVAKKEHLIKLLQEKRQALITQAVTKGVVPTVPMRTVAVPGVDQVPAHWQVERNRVFWREVNDRSVAGDEELLTVSHITGVTRRSEKSDVNMFLAETMEGYKRCAVDDLAINTMWAWMGALGISPVQGIVSPSYNVYRLRRPSEHYPPYFDLLYRTPTYVAEINRWSKGIWSSRLRLYPQEFFSMVAVVPPREEQRRIVEYVSAALAKDDALLSVFTRSIEKLREYRQALITAAVTGQLDISTAAA
jgi:type I restriction enzyme S subunit